jgi:hypothetical protein
MIKFYFFFFAFSFSFLFSQENRDTILFQNGKQFSCNITDVDEIRIDYFTLNKKGKKKTGFIDNYRVFSYKKQNGSTSIMYEYDTLRGNHFKVPEMKNFVLGEFDARQNYKDHIWLSAMTFGLSYGAVLFDTYLTKSSADKVNADNPDLNVKPGMFGSEPSYFPIFVPVVLTAVISIPRFKIRRKQVGRKHLHDDPHFKWGYHRISRQKRLFWQLGGGLGGLGLGYLSYFLFKKN